MAIFGCIVIGLQEVYIVLRHIVAYCFGVVFAISTVALQEELLLLRRSEESLAGPAEHSPGDVVVAVSIASQFKIQNGADVALVPEQVCIVKITVTENLRTVWRRYGEEVLERCQTKLNQQFIRRTVVKTAVCLL